MKPKAYNVSFAGREHGAIGIEYRMNKQVIAIDEQDAVKHAQKRFEVWSKVNVSEA